MAGAPWIASGEGVTLHVRLTPKADRDRIEGLLDLANGRQVIAARVRAVPEKGAANNALAGLIARQLGVPKSAVSLAAGATSRIKTVRIDGAPEALLDRLKVLVG